MTQPESAPPWPVLGHLMRAHPWHGIPIGEDAPGAVNAYIEMLPTDTVKYELDKSTGLLRVDRPQRFSNVCPELYGMIPQTFCGERVAAFCREKTGRTDIQGDGDPMDVCVLTDKHVSHVDIFMRVRPIGGFRMLDREEADDKVVAVLEDDPSYGYFHDISQLTSMLTDRLKHYFLTYKQAPDAARQACEITHTYGVEEAKEVVRRSHEDYLERFGKVAEFLEDSRAQTAMFGDIVD